MYYLNKIKAEVSERPACTYKLFAKKFGKGLLDSGKSERDLNSATSAIAS
jgi:hypothetical protein